MKVVTEFLPNREDKLSNQVEKWYTEAVSFMRQHPGQWVMVDEELEFHRSLAHKEKFRRFNKGSHTLCGDGWYVTEFRYPENGSCVMYGMWIEAKSSKLKRWLGL